MDTEVVSAKFFADSDCTMPAGSLSMGPEVPFRAFVTGASARGAGLEPEPVFPARESLPPFPATLAAPAGAFPIVGIGPDGGASVGMIESIPALIAWTGAEQAQNSIGRSTANNLRGIAVTPRGIMSRKNVPGPGQS